MAGKSITVIAVDIAAATSPEVEAVLAHWSPAERPPVVAHSLEEVLADAKLLDHCGVVWVILDEHSVEGVYTLMSMLQEHHLAGLLTRPEETGQLGSIFQDGTVVAPHHAPSAAVCAILRTLWAQAGVVHALRAEIHALQMHQGGLCEQIGKIDEELRLAAQLQREFLPAKLPRVGPVEFKVFFRPAGYVSGDIYDVIQLDEHHIGFFIADVVGHGVPAALMTMYIKRCLHTKAIDPLSPRGYRIIPPNEALALLNHDMVAQQAAGKVRFATACYGVVNCKTLEMQFARAGHPYPIVLHQDGHTATLESDGGMLGIFPEEQFELLKFQLSPGDRLLLYSDGFEVAFPNMGEDGITSIANPHYAEELKQLAHGPLEEALERLVGRLDNQAGSLNQRDDLTVVCLGVGVEVPTLSNEELEKLITHALR